MKTSSLFTAATVLAAMMAAAPVSAAPVAVYTVTSAVVSQKLVVSGCSTMATGGLANITFYKDTATNPATQTFSIDRTINSGNDVLPILDGTWDEVVGTSTNTIYMRPYNSSVGPDPLEPTPPANGIDMVLDALNVYAQANCSIKYGAQGNSVVFNQPSILVTKGLMTVKNSTLQATLSMTLKGKQFNVFKVGKPKAGAVSSTTTIKGTVVRDGSCPPAPAACSVATVTM